MNTLKFGNGEWYGKKDTILAYNDENSNFKPLPFSFDRASSATVVNKAGLIETVGSGEPRIDYKDDSKGALLLEPSRSNSLVQSNQFDTTWTLSTAIDLTSGQSGVFGSNDAWLLKRNSTGSRYIQQSLSLSSAQYSYSVYLKAESTNWAFIWSYDGSASVNVYFDLQNGVVGSTSGANLDSTKIESVGNGWYRCTLIYTQATTLVRVYPAYANGNVSTGTDNGIYIQNFQLEQGSYATSYIPSSGGVVTRVVDACSGAGNDQVINSTEGVLYAEESLLSTLGSKRTISLSDGTLNNYCQIQFQGSTRNIKMTYETTGYATNQSYLMPDNIESNKIAFLWSENKFQLWVNGIKVMEDLSGATASNVFSELKFSLANGADNFYGNIKDVRVYNTALTDAELQALTSN